MPNRKNLITIGALSCFSLFVLVVGGGIVFARQPSLNSASTQAQATPSSQNQVQGVAEVKAASSNNDSAQVDTAAGVSNNSLASGQNGSSAPASSVSTSFINNENGHETSSPPSDQLISIETEQTGQLSGRVITSKRVPGNPTAGDIILPFYATILVKSLSGTVVASVTPNANGDFSVSLEPGSYKVEPQDADPFYFTPGHLFVEVQELHTTTVSFYYSPIATTN